MTLIPNSLDGARILITRAPRQAEVFARQVERLGAKAIQVPLINVRPCLSHEQHAQLMSKLHSFQWIVFTSVNGVRFFLDSLTEQELMIIRQSIKVASVGTQTTKKLEDYGIRVDLMPTHYEAGSLAESLLSKTQIGEHILIPRGNLARPILANRLKESARVVTDLPVYETFQPTEVEKQLKAIVASSLLPSYLTFTSASTVRHYCAICSRLDGGTGHLFPDAKIICIGPITAIEAKKHGLEVDAIPAVYTTKAMIEEMVRLNKE
ncbi:uroporphyrinogen-III synthase [Alkalihalobacillus sp. FSL R5-0424]